MRKDEEVYEQFGVAMTCRSFSEYEKMFDLSERLLSRGKILDVAGGASSFTAEANKRGYDAAAADPKYAMEAMRLKEEGEREIEVSTEKLSRLSHKFIWDYYGSLENHKSSRERALRVFLDDYGQAHGSLRYVPAELPSLPFADGSFALVLCSHFLFLYHEQFDYDFHKAAILELMRVCGKQGEVRIYPLLSLKWELYPHLQRLQKDLAESDVIMERSASYLPFMPGSSELLKLTRR